MSKHNIHGVNVSITISQGASMLDATRGRCIGKVVNICRDLPAEEFLGAIEDLRADQFGGPRSAALLIKLDRALESKYTKRSVDDFPPVVDIELEG